jgi:hypothetical protein
VEPKVVKMAGNADYQDTDDELLEPFRPRGDIVETKTRNLYRRGSVIVIPSLDDSGSGLLESFPNSDRTISRYPSYMDSNGENDDESDDDFRRESNFTKFSKSFSDFTFNSEMRVIKTVQATPFSPPQTNPKDHYKDSVWDPLSSVRWSKVKHNVLSGMKTSSGSASSPSSPMCSVPKGETLFNLSSQKSNSEKWETISKLMVEADEFRMLKEEMRSSGSISAAAAHRSILLQTTKRQSSVKDQSVTPRDISPARTLSPTSSQRGWMKTLSGRLSPNGNQLSLNDFCRSNPPLQSTEKNTSSPHINLSPFAQEFYKNR